MAISVGNASSGRITSTGNSGQNQRISNVRTASSSPLSVVSGAGSMQSAVGIPGSNTYSPQGGTYNPQQAGTYDQTAGGSTLGASTYGGAGGGGGGGYYDAAAAAAAAEEAAKQARIQQSRDAITGLVGSITGVYDALYGDIGTVARDKTNQLETKYGREIGNLTDEFNSQFPLIGQNYAGRGAYDSGYRIEAEDRATGGYQRSLGDINYNKRQDLAKLGQEIAMTQADINANKGGVQAILAQIGAMDDENALTNLRNELDTKLRTVQASRAGNMSQGAYMQRLNQTVPGAARAGEIRANLQNVLKSAIPTALKRSVATQLVNNAGVDPEIAAALMGEINLQLSQEEKQVQGV
ncbi:MAG TPA: hypothetical protein PKV66_01135 [Candidatus Pelethenecus sp.]|nr:hypothetical protein [Candidatus Pelethenecus sp.]